MIDATDFRLSRSARCEERTKTLLKGGAETEMSYRLAKKLKAISAAENERTLNNNFSRRELSAAFLLQTSDAIGASEVRLT